MYARRVILVPAYVLFPGRGLTCPPCWPGADGLNEATSNSSGGAFSAVWQYNAAAAMAVSATHGNSPDLIYFPLRWPTGSARYSVTEPQRARLAARVNMP